MINTKSQWRLQRSCRWPINSLSGALPIYSNIAIMGRERWVFLPVYSRGWSWNINMKTNNRSLAPCPCPHFIYCELSVLGWHWRSSHSPNSSIDELSNPHRSWYDNFNTLFCFFRLRIYGSQIVTDNMFEAKMDTMWWKVYVVEVLLKMITATYPKIGPVRLYK